MYIYIYVYIYLSYCIIITQQYDNPTFSKKNNLILQALHRAIASRDHSAAGEICGCRRLEVQHLREAPSKCGAVRGASMGRLRFVLLFQGHLRYYTQKNWYLYYIIYIYMHIFGHLQFVVRFFVFIWLKNTVSSSYHIIILSCGIIHFNVVVRLETSQDALAYPHGLAGEHPTIRPTISWFE